MQVKDLPIAGFSWSTATVTREFDLDHGAKTNAKRTLRLMWDAIVLGSGISGLTAATALARAGQRVLLLEQHWATGGLTQTFKRRDWEFATGVHYLSGLEEGDGPGGQFRRMLAWLSDDRIAFAPMANPYDIVRIGDFRFGIAHPRSRYKADLLARFPHEAEAIERWFALTQDAIGAASAAMIARGLPGWLGWLVHLAKGTRIGDFARLTVSDALEPIDDLLLRAVLGARGGDYGAAALDAPLLEHALVTGAYDNGAWYPVGGPAAFAKALVPAIKAHGGTVFTGADVTRIGIEGGRIASVEYQRGGKTYVETCRCVVSTIGLDNTLARLPADTAPDWRNDASGLKPGPSYVTLYLGFDGNIATAGASSANIWLYETPDAIDRFWRDPAKSDAPGLFVSFPSLKDPAHRGKHTAEVLALCDASPFVDWMTDDPAARSGDYAAFKAQVEDRLLAQFGRHFPALGAMVAFHELSTPLSQRRFVRTTQGAIYGLEMSARRLLTDALNIRTPIKGLFIAGQDVMGAGILPSAMSGMLAAAAIRPSLLRHLNG